MGSSATILTILVCVQTFILVLYFYKPFSIEWVNTNKLLRKNEKEHEEEVIDNHQKASIYSLRKKTPLPSIQELQELGSASDSMLFIAVFSHASFTQRRNAIRTSWMKGCSSSQSVICKFITDGLTVHGLNISKQEKNKLKKESALNGGDLVVLDSASGRNFAVRLLIAMEYAHENFDFDFFLRIDDDHYLCLDRLLKELPFRPKERLYWGHLHCQPGVVRIDEGWVLLTNDLIHTFLKTKNSLECGRFADQSLAMWIYDLMMKKKIHWYGDHRIYHHPPASEILEFKTRKEVCHTFLSLHGSYPIEMRVFHLIHEREKEVYGDVYDIPPLVDLCPYDRHNFNWKWFDPNYYTEPISCKGNPIWKEGGEIFLGRSIDIRVKLKKEHENDQRWKVMHKMLNKTANKIA